MLLASQALGAAQPLVLAGAGIIKPIFRPVSSVGLFAIVTGFAGGTSVDAYVQTTFDGGQTFWDVANFHFLASGEAFFDVVVGAAVTTQFTAFTNGTLAANTVNAGLVGGQWQVKWTSVGTFTAGLLQVFGLFR